MTEIKSIIKQLEKRYSIEMIAAKLGYSVTAVWMWKHGERSPKEPVVAALKKMLEEKP